MYRMIKPVLITDFPPHCELPNAGDNFIEILWLKMAANRDIRSRSRKDISVIHEWSRSVEAGLAGQWIRHDARVDPMAHSEGWHLADVLQKHQHNGPFAFFKIGYTLALNCKPGSIISIRVIPLLPAYPEHAHCKHSNNKGRPCIYPFVPHKHLVLAFCRNRLAIRSSNRMMSVHGRGAMVVYECLDSRVGNRGLHRGF